MAVGVDLLLGIWIWNWLRLAIGLWLGVWIRLLDLGLLRLRIQPSLLKCPLDDRFNLKLSPGLIQDGLVNDLWGMVNRVMLPEAAMNPESATARTRIGLSRRE